MTKKPSGNKRNRLADKIKHAQLKMIKQVREELSELHELSIMVMGDQGVLPPLYGGEYLGEDREAISLWGINDQDSPELGAMLLRVLPSAEPDADLRAMRTELDLNNDLPISEFLDLLVSPDGRPLVDGAAKLSKLSMLVALFGNQIKAAPGFDAETMLDYVGASKPHAVFVYVPTKMEGNTLVYLWDDLEHFRAEVVYADSPQLLEAAIWEYRINLALNVESKHLLDDGINPEEAFPIRDLAEWSGYYEGVVMNALRIYGSTSSVRARQLELDVLREENGDLIVKAPLDPGVEPVMNLAEARVSMKVKPNEELIHLDGSSETLQKMWPTVRASNFYGIRMRYGQFKTLPNGELQIDGFSDNTLMDWFMSETLSELYLNMRLAGIYEMLAVCRLINAQPVKNT